MYKLGNESKSQIVLNDKIPNPQGTTQGKLLGWSPLSPQ
jgi:hypothetical protein